MASPPADRATWRAHPLAADELQLIPEDARGSALSWRAVLAGWQAWPQFRTATAAALAAAPFEAFYWETPPLTVATFEAPFACVLTDAPGLVGRTPDESAFAARIADGDGKNEVRTFLNLSRDAELVVPCQNGPAESYTDLARFLRHAPAEQVCALWQEVGRAVEARLGEAPLWLSTSGGGVAWLHVRLDSVPKYYVHDPYRDVRPR